MAKAAKRKQPARKAVKKTVKKKAAQKKATTKKVAPATAKRAAKPRPKAKRSRESQSDRQARAERILAMLHATYGQADCALQHRSAFELLVATILSAQCTDERVNMVTPALFKRYPNPKSLAAAEQAEVESLIRSTGFFRNKAKNIISLSQHLVADHGGEVPAEMDALVALPGVARKTANCVLGTWFGQNEGIVVDTHVGRLALRLRLLVTAKDDKDAVKIEQDLMRVFPRSDWTFLAHALIWHGRGVCMARKPNCAACPLATDCPSAHQFGD